MPARPGALRDALEGQICQTLAVPSLASIVQRAGRTRVFARIGRALMPLDRAVGRLTRGRFVAFGLRGAAVDAADHDRPRAPG